MFNQSRVPSNGTWQHITNKSQGLKKCSFRSKMVKAKTAKQNCKDQWGNTIEIVKGLQRKGNESLEGEHDKAMDHI